MITIDASESAFFFLCQHGGQLLPHLTLLALSALVLLLIRYIMHLAISSKSFFLVLEMLWGAG